MKGYYYSLLLLLLLNACDFKKVKETMPEYSADHYYNKGLTNYYYGNYKESLENYEKAIAIDSSISDYFLNRGAVIEIVYKDALRALKDYQKAIQLDSFNAVAYYNIANVVSDKGYDTEAIEYYKTCLVLDPSYYPAYYNCALSQYQVKDYEEAMKNFKKTIQYYEEQKFYAYYYMGLICKQTGGIRAAKEYLEKAKELGNKKAVKELETIDASSSQ
ncbi:MAG: hypothetical protein LBT25_08755 [Candidatus Symbiothrix sp.]|jgi:tetratricopeptide (TPR) repeat protein|nr:hypothetical protein [Candidatus Symbiothrix sp.]